MKILFFSYLSYDDNHYKGGGWVNSLINVLIEKTQYEIGVVYIAKDNHYKKYICNNISYYAIPLKQSTFLKYYRYITRTPVFSFDYSIINSVIKDFTPDIVQLFGMETPFGGVLTEITSVPVVVHIQGICTAYYEKWFPMGFSPKRVWWKSSLLDKLRLSTLTHQYERFYNLSKMEKAYFKNYNYYLGRTRWDYSVSRLLSPGSKYYVCDELLRAEFYNKKWVYNGGKLIISSVTNGELYKGFDTILRTSHLLAGIGVEFEWNIYGLSADSAVVKIVESCLQLKYMENHVHFCGKKSAQEIVDSLLNSTFYVHVSHIDNSPNALCEAMLLGVPSIATYVGGIPSIIIDKVTGYLVPDSEPYSLAFLIKSLYKSEDALKEISDMAHLSALQRHDENNILDQLQKAYNDIISDFSKCRF